MNGNRREELDTMVERALREWARGETAPERVWERIELTLRDRRTQTPRGTGGLGQLWRYAYQCGLDVLACARIILAPCALSVENDWAGRLVLAGQSHAFYRSSFNH